MLGHDWIISCDFHNKMGWSALGFRLKNLGRACGWQLGCAILIVLHDRSVARSSSRSGCQLSPGSRQTLSHTCLHQPSLWQGQVQICQVLMRGMAQQERSSEPLPWHPRGQSGSKKSQKPCSEASRVALALLGCLAIGARASTLAARHGRRRRIREAVATVRAS